ncbi:MAG: hypothetical protein CMJ06_00840 [Pelagibacterales bacterium]|nr:hypothetical protein [Pelagibacterales bacterium]OUU63594.1 MAG: hypothetical protein CBC22_00810 [Alphaproteobacteria bacterium TMED62]
MKFHWLIKYYISCFAVIFFILFYIENKEPFVNWNLYPYVKEKKIKENIFNKDCKKLKVFYFKEFSLNYKKSFFGYNIRKDKKSIRGLNLLRYLDYHIKKNKC